MKLSLLLSSLVTVLSAIIAPAPLAKSQVVSNAQLLFNVPLGSQGGEVAALGDYAYVAQGTAGIKVVKINGAGSPAVVGTIRPYAGSANINFCDVEINGTTLYVGNILPYNGPTPFTGVFMYDLATDPINPPLAGDISWGVFPGSYMGASAHNICVDVSAGRTYLYVASDITSTVPVYDVTNPAAPEFKDELYIVNSQGLFYGSAHDVAVKNGKLVTTLSAGGFTIHDVSNIAASHIDYQNQIVVSGVSLLNHTKYTGANTWHAAFSSDGNYLVTTDGGTSVGCRTWNLNSITAPNVPLAYTSQYVSGSGTRMHNIQIVDNYVYLSHFMDGCRMLSLAPNGVLSSVGQFDTTASGGTSTAAGVLGVFVHGQKVLLSDITQGLYAIDFIDNLSILKAEWKNSTKTLTVETTSSAAPAVRLTVAGYGQMTWNANTGRYRLVQSGVLSQPTSVTVTSDIGGSQSSSVRRR